MRRIGLGITAILLMTSCTSTPGATPTVESTSQSTAASTTTVGTAATTTSTFQPTTIPVYVTESGYPMEMGWYPSDPSVTLPESPYPEWSGGDELQIGEPWRYWVTIDGCRFEFSYFNGTWWKQSERTYRPGTDGQAPGLGDHYSTHDYPDSWDVYELPVHGGPLIEVDGVITLVSPMRIEATTLDGELIAVYEPTDESPPYCTA